MVTYMYNCMSTYVLFVNIMKIVGKVRAYLYTLTHYVLAYYAYKLIIIYITYVGTYVIGVSSVCLCSDVENEIT